MFEKLKDLVFGKPDTSHVPHTPMNRAQRRHAKHMQQKRNAAAKRKKHEKRDPR